MTERTMIVDLNRLKRDGVALLSGRRNGEQAYKICGLGGYKPSMLLKIINGDELIITNSYFLGMLENIFKKFNERSELESHLDLTDLSAKNKEELLRGINRGFSRAKNPPPKGKEYRREE